MAMKAHNLSKQTRSSTPTRVLLPTSAAADRRAARRIGPPVIQAKLGIGAPNDLFEQEADRVADLVMGMPDGDVFQPRLGPGPSRPEQISRTGAAGEENLQRPPEEETEEELLQAREVSGQAPETASGVATRVNSLGSGKPLDPVTRDFVELRFGHDFSGVRVHAGGEAADTAGVVQARAYTLGRDIVFGPGEYLPATMEGKRLLAHELAHVVQQRQRPQQGRVMRAPAAQPAPVRMATVEEAAEFLEEMARFTL
jgi:hypothetical protein